MPRLQSILALVFVTSLLASCGSSGQLQSISVSPSSATAQNAHVQFTATGIYSTGSRVTPLPVTWTNCASGSACPTAVGWPTVDNAGLAQCNGLSGSFGIFANKTVNSKLIQGSGQLICP